MVSIKNFDSDLFNIDKKSYKNIDIYYIRYLMYFIIGEVDGYVEGSNGKKYLIFPSTDKNIEILTKYTELWNGIKNLSKK